VCEEQDAEDRGGSTQDLWHCCHWSWRVGPRGGGGRGGGKRQMTFHDRILFWEKNNCITRVFCVIIKVEWMMVEKSVKGNGYKGRRKEENCGGTQFTGAGGNVVLT
jgi:hypothetical protein